MSNSEDQKLKMVKWLDKNGIPNFSLEFNQYIRDIYGEIIRLYKNTNYTLEEKGSVTRPKYNNTIILEIINYVLKNDKSLFTNLNMNDKEFLSKLESKTLSFNEIVDWLNVYGDTLLDNVFRVSKLNVLPENFQNRLFDESLIGKYTSLTSLKDIECNIRKKQSYLVSYETDGFTKTIPVNINIKPKGDLSQSTLDRIMRTVILLPKLNEYRLAEAKAEINLYFSSSKKKCPTGDIKILGSNNINSGVTVFKYNEALPIVTTVYRSEEMYKVIIHELIHNFKYDFGFLDLNIKVSDFLNISRDTKLTPNESYTEIVALIINTITESYNFHDIGNYDLFKIMLEYETQFNLFQCAKILLFYGYKNVDEFFQKYDNLNKFKQNSNVFSYFFIKSALLMNFTEVLNFLERYSDNFMLKPRNIYYIKSEFEHLIIKSLKRSNFKKGIDHFFRKITHNSKNQIIKELCKSLRMTIFS
jgi:hypothetical protein